MIPNERTMPAKLLTSDDENGVEWPTAGGCTNGAADEGAGSERESGPEASTVDGDEDNDEDVVLVVVVVVVVVAAAAAEEEEEEEEEEEDARANASWCDGDMDNWTSIAAAAWVRTTNSAASFFLDFVASVLRLPELLPSSPHSAQESVAELFLDAAGTFLPITSPAISSS